MKKLILYITSLLLINTFVFAEITVVDVKEGHTLPSTEAELQANPEFQDKYGNALPVVFRKAGVDWPAMKWTSSYLADNYGNLDVYSRPIDLLLSLGDESLIEETSLDRFTRELLDPNTERYFFHLSNPADTINQATQEEDLLSVINSKILSETEIPFISEGSLSTSLFVGGPNSLSDAHSHEKTVVLQIEGTKRFLLVAPSNHSALECTFKEAIELHVCKHDLENPPFTSIDQEENYKVYEVILKPGDVLFIPDYWIHRVEGNTGPSVTFSIFIDEE